MGKVVISEGMRVAVLTNGEHRPPHVHVIKRGEWELRVLIGDRALLWDVKWGNPSDKEQARAVRLVQEYLEACNAKWEECHGSLEA